MQLGKIPFIGRRARRTWLVLGTVVALTLAIALPGLATLSPSTFNAGDGNLTVQGSETDWATPAHAPTPSSQGRSRSRKTSIKGPSPLAGAEFDIRKASDNSLVAHLTTDSNGVACVDKLLFGNYNVNETNALSGYKIDDTTTHKVTVDNAATCGSGNEETISFSDTPLSKVTVSFESLAPGNPTSATIQCTGEGSPSPLPEGTPKVLDNLAPGTYSCTVVVDP